jgi:hypothetical protein
MNNRFFCMTAAALALGLALAACATGPSYSDLDRVATADDTWPIDLPAHASDGVDVESVRLVGHDGTTALYLAADTMADYSVCLLIYPGGGNWVVGCGGDGMVVGGGSNSYYTVHSDGERAGSNVISGNVSTNADD